MNYSRTVLMPLIFIALIVVIWHWWRTEMKPELDQAKEKKAEWEATNREAAKAYDALVKKDRVFYDIEGHAESGSYSRLGYPGKFSANGLNREDYWRIRAVEFRAKYDARVEPEKFLMKDLEQALDVMRLMHERWKWNCVYLRAYIWELKSCRKIEADYEEDDDDYEDDDEFDSESI